MKSIMLLTGSGPLVILTSFESATAPPLLEKLRAKGIEKFLAYEVPLELAKERNMTLLGFVRHDGFNIYHGGWCVSQNGATP